MSCGGIDNPNRQVSASLSRATTRKATPAEEKKYGGGRGNVDLSSLLAPKGRSNRGRKAPENQYDREALREEEEHLRLLRERTGNLTDQNAIDHQLIDIDLKQRIEQLRQMVDRKALTKDQAAKLQKEEEANAVIQKELADRKMNLELISRSYRNAEESLRLEQDGLDIDRRLARTDKERARIDLAILASKQQQARAEIEKEIAIAKENKDETRVMELTEELATLRANQIKEVKADAIEHLTGMAKFKNDLPKTVEDINEAIDNIRFDLFTERLQRAADMAQDVGDAFGNAAGALARFENPLDVLKGLVSDLAQTFTKNVIEQPVADWASKAIGMPAARQVFGKQLTGPDQLTVQQMNVALGVATQDLNLLAASARLAAGAMGAPGAANTAAGGADALAQETGQATQAMSAQVPVLGQFGSGLMSILSSLSGGGGGGGGGLLSFLKMGLQIAGAAAGGGGGFGALGASEVTVGGGVLSSLSAPSIASVASTLPGWASGGEGEFGGLPGHDRNILSMNGKPFLRVSKGEKFKVDSIAGSKLGDLGPLGLMRMLGQQRGGDQHVHFGDIVVPDAKDDRSARRTARQVMGHVQRGLSELNRKGLNK
jgi:hypothetical protein